MRNEGLRLEQFSNFFGGNMKKNVLKWLLPLFCVVAVSIFGCKTDADDEGGGKETVDYNASGSSELPKTTAKTVIKNKVVNLNGSTDVYYEEYTFTSEKEGTYSLYKGTEKQSKITIKKTEYSVPTDFTYDSKTGKVTIKLGEISLYYYISTAKKGDKNIPVVISDMLSLVDSNADKTSLFNNWESEKYKASFKFNKNGMVSFSLNGKDAYSEYSNDNGWILVGEVPFYWSKLDSENVLYYMIFETEQTVSERAALSSNTESELNFTSNNFLFAL